MNLLCATHTLVPLGALSAQILSRFDSKEGFSLAGGNRYRVTLLIRCGHSETGGFFLKMKKHSEKRVGFS